MRRGFLRAAFCCAVLGSALSPSPLAPAAAPSVDADSAPQTTITFFNHASEKASHTIFFEDEKKWNDAMLRQDLLMKNPSRAAIFAEFIAPLKKILETGKEASLPEKASAVNDYITAKIPYQSDQNTYQVEDYWAAPVETLLRKKGDCEDLAILKYQVLRALGVPADRLYIAMVSRDVTKRDHAVLLMNVAEQGTNHVVLDNARPGLASADSSDYVFFSAVNETKFWWHPEVRKTADGLTVTYSRAGNVHETFITAENREDLWREMKKNAMDNKRGEDLVAALLSAEQGNIISITTYKNSVYEGLSYHRYVGNKVVAQKAAAQEIKSSEQPRRFP